MRWFPTLTPWHLLFIHGSKKKETPSSTANGWGRSHRLKADNPLCVRVLMFKSNKKNTQRMNPWDWYIYLHLVDVWCKLVGKYIIHRSCGIVLSQSHEFLWLGNGFIQSFFLICCAMPKPWKPCVKNILLFSMFLFLIFTICTVKYIVWAGPNLYDYPP